MTNINCSSDLVEEEEITYEVSCSICLQDLNHHLYNIHEHPIIRTPICAHCFREALDILENETAENKEDRCNWCLELDGGELFICGDGASCEHQFCKLCIQNNLGEEYFREVSDSEEWICLVCNPAPLQDVYNSMKIVQNKSIFHTFLPPGGLESASEEAQTEYFMSISREITYARDQEMLQYEERIESLKDELDNEMRLGRSTGTSVYDARNLELKRFKETWDRHFEILLQQEADLSDIMSSLGLQIPSWSDIPGVERSERDKFAIANANKELDMRDAELAKKWIEERDQKRRGEVLEIPYDSTREYSKMPKVEINPLLAKIEVLSSEDIIVKEYSADCYEDPGPDSYPQEFENTLPKSLLKALYHCSDEEREILISKYAIPRHIAVILMHGDKEFPDNVLDWSIADEVHPSVCKAIFYSKTPLDQAIIGSFYDLSEDIYGVTDFGDVDSLYQRTKSSKGLTRKWSSKEYRQAMKDEDTMDSLLVDRVMRETQNRVEKDRRVEDIRLYNRCKVLARKQEKKSDKHKDAEDNIDDVVNEVPSSSLVNYPGASMVIKRRIKIQESRTESHTSFGPEEDEELESKEQRLQEQERRTTIHHYGDSKWIFSPFTSHSRNATKTAHMNSSASFSNSSTSNNEVGIADDTIESDERKRGNSGVSGQSTDSAIRDSIAVGGGEERGDALVMREDHGLGYASNSTNDRQVRVDGAISGPSVKRDVKLETGVVDESDDDEVQVQIRRFVPSQRGFTPLSSSSKSKDKDYGRTPVIDLTLGDSSDDESSEESLQEDASKDKASSKGQGSTVSKEANTVRQLEPSFKSVEPNKEKNRAIDDRTNYNRLYPLSIGKRTHLNIKKKKTISLSSATLEAKTIEKKRKEEMMKFKFFDDNEGTKGMVINVKRPEDDPKVMMLSDFVDKLKDHQKEGVRFLWENVIKSVSDAKKSSQETYGCILAHCMGLGKTFTVISFVVTLLTNPVITSIAEPDQVDVVTGHEKSLGAGKEQAVNISLPPQPAPSPAPSPTLPQSPNPLTMDTMDTMDKKKLIHRVLIVAPKNALQNWKKEIIKWTPGELLGRLKVISISAGPKSAEQRTKQLSAWYKNGGIVIIGYEMFRNMVDDSAETKSSIPEALVKENISYLLNPGPDLVIADEAHIIKDKKRKVSLAFERIRTKRRVALTGSPLQNNLEEYWCMINWVKPLFLYTSKEFRARFILPIKKGESKDANFWDKKEMKKRSYVLHKRLLPVVHRKDVTELTQFLNKREFVLFIRMTEIQKLLYKLFISKLPICKGKLLFRAYQQLMRIWNHPFCAVIHANSVKEIRKEGESVVAGAATATPAKFVYKRKKFSLSFLQRELQGTYEFLHSNADEAKLIALAGDRNERFVTMKIGDDYENSKHGKGRSARNASDSESLISVVGGEEEKAGGRSGDSDGSDSDSDSDSDSRGSSGSGSGSSWNDDKDNDLDSFVVSDDCIEYEDDASNYSDFESLKTPRAQKRKASVATRRSPTGRLRKRSAHSATAIAASADQTSDSEDDLFRDNPVKGHHTAAAVETGAAMGGGEDDNDDNNSLKNITGAGLLAEIEGLDGAAEEIPDIEEDGLQVVETDLMDSFWWKLTPERGNTGAADISLDSQAAVEISNKLMVTLSLLAQSVMHGDKMIIFSQSLYLLDVLELFLSSRDWGSLVKCPSPVLSKWSLGSKFLRIDGSVNDRQKLIDKFNSDKAVKLMLISTKAGNMGINLQAANRVVIFDCSWNPVHDLQAIFRAFRVGQSKDVFVYRLVSAGSMEEKIYKKQVVKQSLSARVVDAQMPDNHFTERERAELMAFAEDVSAAESAERLLELVGAGTQDAVLRKFIEDFGTKFFTSIQEQDTFLADNQEEHLDEAEKQAAVEEFDREQSYSSSRATSTAAAALSTLSAGTSAAAAGLSDFTYYAAREDNPLQVALPPPAAYMASSSAVSQALASGPVPSASAASAQAAASAPAAVVAGRVWSPHELHIFMTLVNMFRSDENYIRIDAYLSRLCGTPLRGNDELGNKMGALFNSGVFNTFINSTLHERFRLKLKEILPN